MTAEEIERIWNAIYADNSNLIDERAQVRDQPLHKARRWVQFVSGWQAALHNRVYTPDTLKLLNWNNLGYRYVKHSPSGFKDEDEVRQVFEYLVENHDGPIILTDVPTLAEAEAEKD